MYWIKKNRFWPSLIIPFIKRSFFNSSVLLSQTVLHALHVLQSQWHCLSVMSSSIIGDLMKSIFADRGSEIAGGEKRTLGGSAVLQQAFKAGRKRGLIELTSPFSMPPALCVPLEQSLSSLCHVQLFRQFYWAALFLYLALNPFFLGFQVISSTSPNWSPGAFLKCWWKNMSGPKMRQLHSQTSYSLCWSWSQRNELQQQSVSGTPGLTPRSFQAMPQRYTLVYSIAYTPSCPFPDPFSPCSLSVWSSSFKASKILDKSNLFCWVCLCDLMGTLLSQWASSVFLPWSGFTKD